MKTVPPQTPGDSSKEIAALIETLHHTSQRLEHLTAGEVDAVADRDGRMFLLRHAQEQLRDSEAAKQAAILDALPAHIALLDSRSSIVSVNQAWRRFAEANALLGPEAAIGVNYLEICDRARGEDGATARQVAVGIRAVLAGKTKGYSLEYPCHSPTQQRWFLMTVTPLADDPPHGVVVMHLDMTQRKRAEQKFRDLLESAPDAMVIVNDKADIVLVNAQAIRLFGWRREELLGQKVDMLVPGHVRVQHRQSRNGYLAQPSARPMGAGLGLFGLHKDGREFPVEISLSPLETSEGTLSIAAIRDISERKRAEQELRESERRFSDVLANIDLVAVILGCDARITYCNDYLLTLSAWKAEELIGRNWFDLFVPPENGELKALFFPALLSDKREFRHHDNEILTRSGERRLIRWNNSVLRSANGEVVGVASIGEDITEQRRAEARILRLNRVYAVQSGINALIVRVHDRDELFAEACRIAVEAGAFRTAWIGVIDPHTLDGRIVAWHGADQDYVNSIKLSARGSTTEHEPPACRALRQGQPVICNDIATEPSLAPRREVLLQRGYRSMGCFPLTLEGRPEAVVALFAGEPDFFDAEEVKLLADLAANLSFALDNIEQEKTLKIVDAQRREGEESLRRFSSAMDATADAIYLVDRTSMRFIHVNDAACRMQGQTREELLALGPVVLLATSRAELERTYDDIIASGADAEPLELLRSRKDGSQAWVELRRHAQRSGERWTIITLVRDITEKKHYEQEILATKTRLQGMLDALPDLLFELGLDGRYYAYHSPRRELLAAPAEELLGRTVAEVLPADAADIVLSALREANTTGHSAGKQFKLALPQGILWFELSVARMAIVPGQEPRFVCLSRDITERKQAELELRENEARFRSLTALSTDWYWQQDADLRFVEFSGGDHVNGWGSDQLTWVGLQRWEIPGIVPISGTWQEHKALLEGRKPFRDFEYQRPAADGTLSYVEASGEPIFDADGDFAGYRGVATDITVRKSTEHRIRRLNRVHAVLSGINTLIVREHDRDALFREACRIAVEEGGFRMTWIGLVDPKTMELVPVAAAGTTVDAGTLVNQRFSLLDPAPHGNTLSARAIRDKTPMFTNDVPNDPAIVFKDEHARRGSRSMAILPLVVSGEAVGVLALYAEEAGFFDEDELKLLAELAGDIAFAIDHIGKEAKLNYLAYYDPLTGLANRSLFLDRVTQYLRSALSGKNKLAVFLIDLARFKNINDSLGRAAGDELLRQVAEWLTRKAAGDANQVARVGADQFVVVMPEVTQDCDVARHLEITMEALADHPFHLNDSVFRIAARVGIAVFPDDGGDAETLFRNAEAALKLAKVRGERYLFYTQKMTDAVASKLTLENQLRQALDNQEFVLHYQPKVSLTSGKVVSAEALIRWNDPRTGLVPPGRFIPILEETGLIYEVGRWALSQAIADYLRWRATGLPAVRIAVNVSPLQLRNSDFIDEIARVIAIDEHAATGLELEITESVIMEDVKGNIASLQAIRAMGVSIAIDDFGTGFSSLSYLAKLPVDTLKIDRSFVINMTETPEGLALVSTIISLAHSLKLKVVAEGVETEEQARLLRLLDCDEMQGFLFSKPLPAEIFEARFLASETRA